MISWRALRFVLFLLVIGCLGADTAFDKEDEKKSPLRLILDLSDGSHIMGSPTRETLPFQSSLAKVNIPLKSISAIQFKGDRETVKISFQNGDQLQGVLNLDAIEVTTLFGKVSIDMHHITSLRVSNNGSLATSVREGLLLYYSFDEDEGERVSNKSGKEHHGKVDGAQYTAKGKTGGAYTFDGNAGIHAGNIDFSSGKYTISGWIRTDRAAVREDWRMWIGKLHPSAGGPFELFLGDGRIAEGGNGPRATAWNGGNGVVSLNAPSLNFRDGNWHMVTATYEKGSRKLYADGILAASTTSSEPFPSNTTSVVIGGMNFGPYHHPWIGDKRRAWRFGRETPCVRASNQRRGKAHSITFTVGLGEDSPKEVPVRRQETGSPSSGRCRWREMDAAGAVSSSERKPA